MVFRGLAQEMFIYNQTTRNKVLGFGKIFCIFKEVSKNLHRFYIIKCDNVKIQKAGKDIMQAYGYN